VKTIKPTTSKIDDPISDLLTRLRNAMLCVIVRV
jgi:hypothetical protein